MNYCNYRPAAGGLLIFCLLCCLCIPALAETVVIDDAGYNAAFGNYPSSSTNYLASPKALDTLVFDKIHNCQEMRAFRAVGTTNKGFFSFPDGPQSFPVEFRIDGASVGYGRYGTFKVEDTGTVWISFDSWDVSEYTGKKTVKIVKLDADGVFPTILYLCSYSPGGEGGSWSPDNYHKVWFDTSPQIMQPLLDCEVYYSDTFKNTYTIEFNEGWAELSLIRNIDGRAYASSLYVNTPVQTYSTGTVLQTNDVQINYISGSPIDIGIKSASGVWYNRTFVSPTDPGDPGDPGAHYQFSIPSIQPGSAVPVLWTGDPFTVTFDCSSEAFADVDFISYTFGSPEYYRTNQQSGDGSWSAYKRVGADWFEYNHDTYEFSIPSSAAQARAHTFPGPRLGPDDDNAYKFLGVARAGLGNEVCDQTTYVRVDGPPVAPDASWTGLRVYLWDASSGDLIGQTAQISILHPSGTEIAAASTSNGWVELKIPRPDPWDPSFRYRVQATVSGYQQTDDVYVLPLAIYPAYEVAEVRLYPDSAGPDDPGAGILQFYISDQATGRPIPGARLEVRGPTGPAHLKIVNNQGTARLELPGNLTYSYRIEADGYAGISGTIYLTAGGTSTVRQGLTTGWPTDPPTTPPTGGIPDEDDDSDGFLVQSVRGITNLFGVSFGVGKTILGMLLALGIGTATAKHLRGGAQEFGMGMLGGVVLGVLIGLLPIWVLVLLVLIVGLWIGQRYMSGGDS